MNLDFTDDSLNRETSPVSAAFKNASFGEFQRNTVELLRACSAALTFTDSFTERDMRLLEQLFVMDTS